MQVDGLSVNIQKMSLSTAEPVDIFVVSSACCTAINRSIYKEFIKSGKSLILVVPREIRLVSGVIKAEEAATDDPPILFMDLQGENSRVSHFIGITEALNKYQPKTIVLDNDPISITALQLGIWSRYAGSKLFCISCENMSLGILASFQRRGIRGFPQAIFKKLLLSITKRLVHGVFTINNEGTNIFRDEGFNKVMRIPLGFDPKYFRIDPYARETNRTKLNLDGFVIGFFGRITYEKGVHLLIYALEKLTEYKWTLLIDEFDTYKNKYGEDIHRRLSEANLLERVVFINPKHTEMGGYINSVDVVVMPSISTRVWVEQYGRVAAEAMACGKLVVASDSGALPMLLNGRGLLFREGKVDALADILRNLISMGLTVSTSYSPYSPEEISEYAHKMLSTERQMQQMKVLFEK